MVPLRHVRGLRHSVRGDHVRAGNRVAIPSRSGDRGSAQERRTVSTINPGVGRVLAGVGGVLLIASLFMPWAEGPGGINRDGWEFLRMSDVFFLIVGLCGIAA